MVRRGYQRLGILLGWVMSLGSIAVAQVGTQEQLQQAIADQNWQQAIQIIDQLLETDPARQAELQDYRRQLEQRLQGQPTDPSDPSTPGSADPNPTPEPRSLRTGGYPIQPLPVTPIYNFSSQQGAPIRLISGQDGALYGITAQSLVFRLSLEGDLQPIFTPENKRLLNHPLLRFPGGKFFQAADGNFYGLAMVDPDQSGRAREGLIYRLTPEGEFTPLFRSNHRLDRENPDRIFPPVSLMQAADGVFYGITSADQIFRFVPSEGLTLLNQIDTPILVRSLGLLQTRQGQILGVRLGDAEIKSFHYGDLFWLQDSGPISFLHRFNGVNGSYPSLPIQAADGHFYGTTQRGGSAVGYPSEDFTDSRKSFSVKCTSCSTRDCLEACKARILQEVPYLRQVPEPFQEAVVFWDCLHHQGCGIVYRLTQTGELTRLYSFSYQEGQYPVGSLVETDSGDLYGVTSYGGKESSRLGARGQGTIFRITPAGQLTYVHEFDRRKTGAYPNRGLIWGADGNLYGTTSEGGAQVNHGTVYRVTLP